MPNLVGTGLNQVPSNSMLGGMAYQDPDRVKIKKLNIDEISQINSEISDTATDIFIYDTSKDSDGGAWRKRTTNTSWYNEPLGTDVRGTRREFPAVAVIVLESASGGTEGVTTDFTIYDGDDPNLPMWMVYKFKMGSGTNTSIAALNGQIVFGATNNGILISDFLADTLRIHNHVHRHTYHLIYPSRLGRTASASIETEMSITGYNIINEHVNDVSMTVLPNAPIDNVRGLPNPTIAVASNGGLAVIRDDGVVLQRTHGYGGSMRIDIDGDLIAACHNGRTGGQNIEVIDLLTLTQIGDGNSSPVHADNSVGTNENDYGYGTNNGANYMPFQLPNFGSPYHPIINGLDLYFGRNYLLQLHESRNTPAKTLTNFIAATYNTGWMPGRVVSCYLSDTDTTDRVNGNTDADRSLSNAAVTVTGNIAKDPVATGAELVAYSGWGSSNYMDNISYGQSFGNPAEITIMVWQKYTDISDYGYTVSFSSGNNNRGGISNGASSTSYPGQAYFNMGSVTLYTGTRVDDGNWHCLVGTIDGTSKKFYLDGKLMSEATISNYDMNSITKIHVGSFGATHSYAHRGSLALLRVSKSVATEEQIKKMYDDERHLFQENAKAVLYGTSNTITALAYDEVTGRLHAGTSAGRSDFQGLRRINNTTTAVTTAISAHDGFIVEQ